MAEGAKAGKIKKAAMAGGKDCFEDLPEPVLELLLSFLPSRDAVRTSVLARRWRTLWKSVPALRLNPSQFGSAQVFNNFVNKLLEHRDRTSPLHECEIFPYPEGEEDETHHVESWVQYAISCRVSVLRVLYQCADFSRLGLSNSSVISKDLTRLELYNLAFDESPLDLLSCEALEVLEIDECFINLGDILPKSLHHLKIRDSRVYSMQAPRNCLSAPGLLTFELAGCFEWTPLLESLPSLVTSFIRIGVDCEDACTHVKYLGDCGDESCEGCYGEDDRCLLLEGLAGATNLELISEYSMFFDIGSSGSYDPTDYFLVSTHLKVVEIHCSEEDEWIYQIVNILGIHGVTSAQISIKHGSWSSFSK